jgi:CRISPR/Cas system Type II protein with McrA/HNH and RuvC-like nuclease domain
LLKDVIKDYADGDGDRVAAITIEVNRDLREFSGKTAKEIQQDLGLRISNHHKIATRLEKELAGTGTPVTASLIRKARVAEDLGWKCPYTGQSYDLHDLTSRTVDRDHVVPRSQRASDSLDSLVITFSEVNRMKGNRTALQFIEEEGGSAVEGMLVTVDRLAEWFHAQPLRIAYWPENNSARLGWHIATPR